MIYQQLVDAIKNSNRIVITSHKSPDGDSIGSSVGMLRFIQSLGGKDVCICHPDKAPSFLNWIEELQNIILFENQADVVQQKINQADLLICLDYNHFSRVGNDMRLVLESFKKDVILIDHHLNPSIETTLFLSKPEVCSTSQLVYEMIVQSDEKQQLNAHITTPLYLGIVTDTGSFRFPSVTARTHQIIAEMIEMGVQHSFVHEQTFDNNTLDRLKLRGFAISEKLELFNSNKIALISLSQAELNQFNYQKGDTEGLVNLALSIKGVKAAILITEKDEQIRMSFRGKEDFVVNIIASEQFQGGGHQYAAGGTSFESLQDTISHLKREIPNYFS